MEKSPKKPLPHINRGTWYASHEYLAEAARDLIYANERIRSGNVGWHERVCLSLAMGDRREYDRSRREMLTLFRHSDNQETRWMLAVGAGRRRARCVLRGQNLSRVPTLN